MKLPATTLVRQFDTHRLIPSKYSDGGDSVLVRIADDDGHLKDIFDLDNAIQRLNASGADDAARAQLVGCYHNLLRMWAEC